MASSIDLAAWGWDALPACIVCVCVCRKKGGREAMHYGRSVQKGVTPPTPRAGKKERAGDHTQSPRAPRGAGHHQPGACLAPRKQRAGSGGGVGEWVGHVGVGSWGRREERRGLQSTNWPRPPFLLESMGQLPSPFPVHAHDQCPPPPPSPNPLCHHHPHTPLTPFRPPPQGVCAHPSQGSPVPPRFVPALAHMHTTDPSPPFPLCTQAPPRAAATGPSSLDAPVPCVGSLPACLRRIVVTNKQNRSTPVWTRCFT